MRLPARTLVLTVNNSRMQVLLVLVVSIAAGFTQVGRSEQIRLQGYCFEKDSLRPIAGVVIQRVGSRIETRSNADGSYTLSLPRSDTLVLLIHRHGYRDQEVRLTLVSDSTTIHRNFLLEPLQYQLPVIDVTSVRPRNVSAPLEIESDRIDRIPTLGEPDVVQAAAILPGIAKLNDFSAQIIIRGSDPSQQMIFLDDFPLFNLFHLGGIVSVINPDIVKRLEIFPSNYPPTYGGALSSSVVIRTRDGSFERLRLSGSLGMLSSRVSISTPLMSGSLLFAARRTYFDLLAQLFGYSFPYNFYDVYARYRLPLGGDHFISSTVFLSKDSFDIFAEDAHRYSFIGKQQQPQWGNGLNTIEWHWIPAPGQFLSLSGYATAANMRSNIRRVSIWNPQSEEFILIDNKIRRVGVKSRLEWRRDSREIILGFDLSQLHIRHFWDIQSRELSDIVHPPQEVFFDFAPPTFNLSSGSKTLSTFILTRLPAAQNILTTLGGRIDFLSDLEHPIVLPFVSVEFAPDTTLSVHASYGEYYQWAVMLRERQKESVYSTFGAPFLPIDGRTPRARHFSTGIRFNQIITAVNASVEVYWLSKRGLPSVSDLDGLPHYFQEQSYGIDFFVELRCKLLELSASYSMGRSVRLDRNVSFRGSYDRPHMFKTFFSYFPTEKLTISGLWSIMTRFPYSEPSGVFIGGYDAYRDRYGLFAETDGTTWLMRRPINRHLNNRTSPVYHRLDITASYALSFGSVSMKLFATILNVYGKNNKVIVDIGTGTIPPRTVEMQGLPTVPMIGVSCEL